MLRRRKRTRRAPMLALLMLLLAGCASELPTWSPPVEPAAIPPLPAEARQPSIPSECLPTCSKGLTGERESWLNMLTPPESPGKPASEPTMRSQ